MLGNFPCYTMLVKRCTWGLHAYHGSTLGEMMGAHEGAVEGEDSQELQR